MDYGRNILTTGACCNVSSICLHWAEERKECVRWIWMLWLSHNCDFMSPSINLSLNVLMQAVDPATSKQQVHFVWGSSPQKCAVDRLQSQAGISSFNVKPKYNDGDDTMWVCLCVCCAVKLVRQLFEIWYSHSKLSQCWQSSQIGHWVKSSFFFDVFNLYFFREVPLRENLKRNLTRDTSLARNPSHPVRPQSLKT